MIKIYPAIIHEEDGYWVEFPDLPGCQSCGSTLEETIAMASESLGLYLVDILEQGRDLPPASSVQSLQEEHDGLVNYISTDVNMYRRNTKAVKKTLSIPAWLAEAAESQNLSLSKVLQEGIKQRLGL